MLLTVFAWTVKVSCCWLACDVESVTCAENVNDPVVEADPVSAPLEASIKIPGGSPPVTMRHEYGATPPVAIN